MDANEIMTNEEVVEVTEEILTTDSGKALKVTAGIGLAILVGGLAYRYILKPTIAKIKAKKDESTIDDGEPTVVYDDCECESEEETE